jgi:hypothetical protein
MAGPMASSMACEVPWTQLRGASSTVPAGTASVVPASRAKTVSMPHVLPNPSGGAFPGSCVVVARLVRCGRRNVFLFFAPVETDEPCPVSTSSSSHSEMSFSFHPMPQPERTSDADVVAEHFLRLNIQLETLKPYLFGTGRVCTQ